MNYTDPIIIGGMFVGLGYLIKRWINGTGKEVHELKEIKVNKETCNIIHQNIKESFDEVKGAISRLHDDVRRLMEDR